MFNMTFENKSVTVLVENLHQYNALLKLIETNICTLDVLYVFLLFAREKFSLSGLCRANYCFQICLTLYGMTRRLSSLFCIILCKKTKETKVSSATALMYTSYYELYLILRLLM